jgi:hypothetical protein
VPNKNLPASTIKLKIKGSVARYLGLSIDQSKSCTVYPEKLQESLPSLPGVGNKEVLYLHRGALTPIFGPFGADVLL